MKVLFTIGALFGALAVILGAFGAHTLKESLSAAQLTTFETAVRYQFYHVFAISLAAILWIKFPQAGWVTCGWLFLIGIVFFSGSLYLLACKDLLNLGNATKIIGPITPIGGLLLMSGWIVLAINIFKVMK